MSSGARRRGGWFSAESFGVDLLEFGKLPKWMQDNGYILTGYRPPLKSFTRCFESLLYVHNETCNVYSHLLGFLLFGILLGYAVVSGWMTSGPVFQSVSVALFFVGTMVGMAFSTLFHLVFCHSPSAHSLFSRLDYTGIAVMIAGSFFPSVYHAFYCEPHLQAAYMSMICLLGIGCIVVSLLPRFANPEWRLVRMSLFLAMGGSGIIPALHAGYIHDWDLIADGFAIGSHALMGILYVGGAIAYGLRIPERIAPGMFDIVGASHQFFHVCVVVAAFSHYRAIVWMKDWRELHPCGHD